MADLGALSAASGNLLIILKRKQVRVLLLRPIRFLRPNRDIASDARHIVGRCTTAIFRAVIGLVADLGGSTFFVLQF